ncbi:MAG: hypothetical protein HZB99_00385 [Candidatus Harrisonbacteria bacterium]|nr:hypothetical protein [Candidatus Harrisonbacteria bacterium]
MVYNLHGKTTEEIDVAYIRPTIQINLDRLEKKLRKFPFVLDAVIFVIPDYQYGFPDYAYPKQPTDNPERVLIFLNIDRGAQEERLRRIDSRRVEDSKLEKEFIDMQIRGLYETEGIVGVNLISSFGWRKSDSLLRDTGCLGDLPIRSYIVDLEEGEDFKAKAQKLAQEYDQRDRQRLEDKNNESEH